MGNRVLSVHQEHELLLKLEQAGFGSNEAQAVIESPENELAGQIVTNIRSKYLPNKLLEPISTINVAGTSKFVARDHFKPGEVEGVKIGYLSDNFKSHFLKKVEENVPQAQLKSRKLKQSSLDPPIITALGDNHETYLAQLWELLKAQPKGESGTLLTNGYANIFYIRDADNILWAVDMDWRDGSWGVDAYSIGYPGRWSGGDQVFGRWFFDLMNLKKLNLWI